VSKYSAPRGKTVLAGVCALCSAVQSARAFFFFKLKFLRFYYFNIYYGIIKISNLINIELLKMKDINVEILKF
jgi:hypothetical protein